MSRRFFNKAWLLLSLFPGFLVLACSAGTGGGGGGGLPSGGNGGAGVGEVAVNLNSATGLDTNTNTNNQNNFTSPQAGGEGHGQEGKKQFRITVGLKEGPSNCGLFGENSHDIFPPGEEESPQLNATFGTLESGPFYNPRIQPMGSQGRVSLLPCPDLIRRRTEQVIFNDFINVDFTSVQATYTDPTGKFFQSESKVLDCSVESCTVLPCEICLTLEEKTVEDSGSARDLHPIQNPGFKNLQPLPSIENQGANSNLRRFEGTPNLLELSNTSLKSSFSK